MLRRCGKGARKGGNERWEGKGARKGLKERWEGKVGRKGGKERWEGKRWGGVVVKVSDPPSVVEHTSFFELKAVLKTPENP